jgi:two-component system chemotaxis response regulator CheY
VTGDAAAAHRCSVLIVDDDETVREVLELTLRSSGYNVAAVGDGRAALDHLRSHDRTCVILIDLLLPVMDGKAFRAAQLRDRSIAWIPVVIMSGVADAREQARQLGAAAFVQKPLDIARIQEIVRTSVCRESKLPAPEPRRQSLRSFPGERYHSE